MTQIKDRTELLTLKDDDLLVISDSASNVIKKLKWSTVKNYFQSGGSLAPWKYINSNYLASTAERLMIDASSPITITLPSSPQIGQENEFSIIRGSAGVSLNFNGNKYLGNNPIVSSYKTLKTPAKLIYESSTNGWFCANPDLIAAKSYELEILDNSPWAYYRLNESSGTVATDSSSNSRNGTYQGGVSLQQTGGLSYASNKAISLNGNTGYISTSTLVASPNTFCYECLFKTSTASGSLFGFSINQLTGGGSYDRELYLSSGKLRFYAYNGSSQILETTSTYNDSKWHIATAYMSPFGMKLFVDGALKASNSVVNGASYSGYFHIGYSVSGGFFNGLIDEPSICLTNIPGDSKIIQQHLSALA
ncbi:LamG-like jellyroll fold domain-containing protein [Nostoc linckia]|uniref:LamG-like jellyroll fold domain-containing protein n=1 Tax=Nostoc linckia TaxID=92942 RepID=UPI000BFF89E3|nr:LamG-like jellyroll fold domain-containing protein [Nostoc linckia]